MQKGSVLEWSSSNVNKQKCNENRFKGQWTDINFNRESLRNVGEESDMGGVLRWKRLISVRQRAVLLWPEPGEFSTEGRKVQKASY